MRLRQFTTCRANFLAPAARGGEVAATAQGDLECCSITVGKVEIRDDMYERGRMGGAINFLMPR